MVKAEKPLPDKEELGFRMRRPQRRTKLDYYHSEHLKIYLTKRMSFPVLFIDISSKFANKLQKFSRPWNLDALNFNLKTWNFNKRIHKKKEKILFFILFILF